MLRHQKLEKNPLEPFQCVGVGGNREFVDLLILINLEDVLALGFQRFQTVILGRIEAR
jgi:hypothetical protein